MRHARQKIPAHEWLENGLLEHNLPAPANLIECDTVADIGAGIRPMNWYQPKTHICVEPFPTYRQKLSAAGYATIGATATEFLGTCRPVEAIYLLDVIEHLHKNDGWHVLGLALEKAQKQIVIYTPKGFLQQDEDGWDLGGDHWQKHRSGWLPGEFPGWQISFYGKGFFAVWNT